MQTTLSARTLRRSRFAFCDRRTNLHFIDNIFRVPGELSIPLIAAAPIDACLLLAQSGHWIQGLLRKARAIQRHLLRVAGGTGEVRERPQPCSPCLILIPHVYPYWENVSWYFVNGSITRSNQVAFGNLFAPSGKSIGESTVPGRTFFECKNGAPAIVVNDRNIKPRPVFEQLHVTLHIDVDRR